MDYNKIRKRPTQWLSLTGMTIEEFDALLPYFSAQWEEYNSHYTLDGKLRQRICYTRVCSILPRIETKLFFVLLFCKTNPLQEQHAAYFGITQPQANKMIHLLLRLLHKTLKELQMIPERNAMRLSQTVKSLSDVLLDGTERPIQRSCDYELQEEQFSGKKKDTASKITS
jgi:hypothetical protein